MLIDPEGEAVWVGKRRAEVRGHRRRSSTAACRTIASAGPAEAGAAARSSRVAEPPTTPLRFPGKVLADEAGDRLFIADSNHNRIVVTDLDGKLRNVIGTGADRPRRRRIRRVPVQSSARHGARRRQCCTWPTPRTICCARSICGRSSVTTIAGTGEQGDGCSGPRSARRAIRRAAAARRRSTARGHCGFTATICTSPWPGRTRFGRCRSMSARSARTPATAARTSSTARCCRNMPYDDRLFVVRPAERPGVRRQVAVRGRQRREHDPRRAVRSGQARWKRSSGVTGTLFDFGDVDGTAAKCGCSIRWACVVTTASCTSPTPTTTRSR